MARLHADLTVIESVEAGEDDPAYIEIPQNELPLLRAAMFVASTVAFGADDLPPAYHEFVRDLHNQLAEHAAQSGDG